MPIVGRHTNAQLKAGARHSTLETAYSRETGYPFDDSRQIGNTSQFENGIVLILKWTIPLTLSVNFEVRKMDYPLQTGPVYSRNLPEEKIGEGVSNAVEEGATVHRLVWIIPF